MALIKEPYGLVRNTDGTLCTTYRDDVVPFRGVRSFAVETATTNLVQNPQFLNGTANYGIQNWGGTGYIEVVNNIMNMHNESSTANLALLQDFTIDNTKEHTISCRVRSANGQDCPIDVWFGAGYYNIGTAPASGAWVTLERTYVPSELAASSAMHIKIPSGKYVQIDWLQFEQKPYPTSFVDGSRAGGIVNFSGFNENSWVANFWYKNSYPGSLGEEGFGMRFVQDTGYLHFRNGLNNAQFILSQDSVSNQFYIFVENMTDGQWRNFVVIYDPNELKFYVNGVYRATVTAIDFTRNLTGIQLWGKTNSLFSNLYVGKYRKPNGTVIWTDDYIREVYEAQIPFPESNKLSIY